MSGSFTSQQVAPSSRRGRPPACVKAAVVPHPRKTFFFFRIFYNGILTVKSPYPGTKNTPFTHASFNGFPVIVRIFNISANLVKMREH